MVLNGTLAIRPGIGPMVSTPSPSPHHIEPRKSEAATFPANGKVLVTEIPGSENVVHFDLGGEVWVSQSHGVHPFEIGEDAVLYAQIGQAIYFDVTGNRVEA